VKIEPAPENVQEPLVRLEPLLTANAVRIISNPSSATTNKSGTKRQRVVTPAATKAINGEVELTTSPSVRKISLGKLKQDGEENDRKALGAIENV
jgi:hypothetical protein